jgi:hypothetical protein
MFTDFHSSKHLETFRLSPVSLHGGPRPCVFLRVGSDAVGATLVRSTPPVVNAVVVAAWCPRFAPRHGTSAVFTSLVLGC